MVLSATWNERRPPCEPLTVHPFRPFGCNRHCSVDVDAGALGPNLQQGERGDQGQPRLVQRA